MAYQDPRNRTLRDTIDQAVIPDTTSMRAAPVQPPKRQAQPIPSGLVNQIPGEAPSPQAAAPKSPGLLRQMFPNTSAASDTGVPKIRDAIGKGNYAGAVGGVINMGLRQANGLVQDTFVEPYRQVGQDAQRAVAGSAARAGAGALGMEAPSFERTASSQSPVGSMAGSPAASMGRSTMLDITNYKPPGSPTASAFDRRADVRAAATGEIPKSLRDGRAWNSGNTYVGADVKEGAPIVDARTGMNRPSRGSVNTLDMSAGRESDARLAAQYDARQAAERAAMGSVSPMAVIGDGGGYGILSKEFQAGREIAPTQGARESRAAYAARLQYLSDRSNTAQREQDSLRGNTTTQRGQDINRETTLRGQDITQRGQDLTAENAANRLRYDAFKEDREFTRNLTNDQRAARKEGFERVSKQLDTFATTMVDGKPVVDPQKRALFEERINGAIGNAIEAARKAGNNELADRIAAEGVSGLDDSSLRRVLRAAELEQAATEDNGFWWWKGDKVDSDNPEDFLPKLDANGKPVIEKGLIWDNAVLRGGSRVDPDYLNKFGGSPTRRYDNLR
jgi:hypothetical protein